MAVRDHDRGPAGFDLTRLLPLVVVGASIVVALLMTLLAEPSEARSGGIINRSGNPEAGDGATCVGCHMSGADEPTVTIDAPASVNAGETVTVSVTISGGPGVVAGFNASVSDLLGTVASLDATTRESLNQVTHNGPLSMVNGTATFSFAWTAPDVAGPLTIYAAGISANGNSSNSGDGMGRDTHSIEVLAGVVPGDVDCSGDINVVDSLMVVRFDLGLLTDVGACPLQDPSTQIAADRGDVNGDQVTDILDALFITQCGIGVDNGFCP